MMAQERITLSVVMIVKDDGRRLRDSLASVFVEGEDFADEVIVADTGSRDDTPDIAREMGARVIDLPFTGFGETKQRALDHATGDWVFALDSDEVISPALRTEIRRTITDTDKAGFIIPRISWFLGKRIRHGGWGQDEILRLFRREQGRYNDAPVHEKVIITGPAGRLDGHLEHNTDPYFPQYLAKIDRYSTLAARQIAADPKKRTGTWPALAHASSKFWRMLILKGGWRDGIHGLLLAVSSGYTGFMRYTKAELIRRGEADYCLDLPPADSQED
ncbi:MAG: glycosyltransferase family 2 protein [bacterium]|nr:glycosyltransferase family 2 protein [bacterium]